MHSDEFIISKVKPFTMTSPESLRQTLDSIDYVIKNNIHGHIIEIGVWRGGTIMAMLLKLMQLGVTDRHVHLYDTFSGMTEPSAEDVNVEGAKASWLCENVPIFRCEASIYDVRKNISMTGYPEEFIHYHIGDIRKVDPSDIPETIALLRLDNDWYELYKFELPVFEPRVQPRGIVTIDDYGYWSGCKKAVDDYLRGSKEIISVVPNGPAFWYK